MVKYFWKGFGHRDLIQKCSCCQEHRSELTIYLTHLQLSRGSNDKWDMFQRVLEFGESAIMY